uniref:DNA repair exonuclease n=1 Tax=Ignisphaera aggregans TaxID=334771 RepID=A0A7C4BCW6_9CREN
MLAVHVSDTHLGAMPFGLFSRAKDIYSSFIESIEIALRERVSFYIHSGDFFDSPNPPPEAYLIAYRNLRKLKERNIRVIVTSGQHDIPKKVAMSPLQLLLDLGVIDTLSMSGVVQKEFEIEGKRVNFICVSYSSKASIPSLGKPLKECHKNVLVAHLLLKELGIPSEQADLSLSQIPGWLNYIALGDYHIKTELRRGAAYAVYPGATEVLKVNECCDKYVALIDLSVDFPKPQYIKLYSVRPWVIVNYRDMRALSIELSNRLSEIKRLNLKQPIVVVNVLNSSIEPLERYLTLLRDRGEIEYFRLVYSDKGVSNDDAMLKVRTFVDELEYINVPKLIEQIVRDTHLAQLLTSLVKEPSKAIAKSIADYLRESPEATKLIESITKVSILTNYIKSKSSDGKS